MQLDSNFKLIGEKIYLRPLAETDATEEYLSWLTNPEINHYMEVRFFKHSLESIAEFIRSTNNDPDSIIFTIVRSDNGKRIGNIKLGPINRYHMYGEIGIMIGDKDSWGQGFATQAVKLLSDYAFGTLKLHKLIAGIYASNTGSLKAFLKNGFVEEGLLKKHCRSGDEYVDVIKVAKFNE